MECFGELIRRSINHPAISISHYLTKWIPFTLLPHPGRWQGSPHEAGLAGWGWGLGLTGSAELNTAAWIVNAPVTQPPQLLPSNIIILSSHLMQELANISCKLSNPSQPSLFARLNKYIYNKSRPWLIAPQIDCGGATKAAWQLIDNSQWKLWLMSLEQTADGRVPLPSSPLRGSSC